MVVDELRNLIQDILVRLARIEEKQDAHSILESSRFSHIEEEIQEINDERKWVWRSIFGIGAMAVWELVRSLAARWG